MSEVMSVTGLLKSAVDSRALMQYSAMKPFSKKNAD